MTINIPNDSIEYRQYSAPKARTLTCHVKLMAATTKRTQKLNKCERRAIREDRVTAGPLVTIFRARQNKAIRHLLHALTVLTMEFSSTWNHPVTRKPHHEHPPRSGSNEANGEPHHQMAACPLVTIYGVRHNKAYLAFFTRIRCSLWSCHPPSTAL